MGVICRTHGVNGMYEQKTGRKIRDTNQQKKKAWIGGYITMIFRCECVHRYSWPKLQSSSSLAKHVYVKLQRLLT
jgi:hypothetical protein